MPLQRATGRAVPTRRRRLRVRMFTGIVEEMGTVVSLTRRGDVALWDGTTGEGWVLVVGARAALAGAYLGCSIAVNGTCLTVTAFDGDTFTVGCAPET
jgi:riboflavin synthase